METFIVRIYRQGKTIPHRLVGIVEKSGLEGKQAFTCLDELWALLNPPSVRKARGRPGKEIPDAEGDKDSASKQKKTRKKGEHHER